MHSVILVDDEELARQRIRGLLKPFAQRIEIIGEAANGEQAVDLIQKKSPDVVFLDVEMPVFDGFEVLQQIEVKPAVVFTTAYDQYAIRAFEENAVDYLLKPIEKSRFERTMEKLITTLNNRSELEERIRRLVHMLEKKDPAPIQPKLRVRVGDTIHLIPVEDILYFESEMKYTNVITNQNKYILEQSLVELEKSFPGGTFLRLHRSYLINSDKISEIERKPLNKTFVILDDERKTRLPVGRNYYPTLKKIGML